MVVTVVAFAIVAAACGSGVAKSSPSTTSRTSGPKVVDVPGLGTGVTATSIKLGVIMV
ncbi:MAG: hypothetical protein QOH10_878, partial [Actinomycetota bacterium]|nr:hypothetical protein [Actinomycetota bacterium]